jgi:hypothetical protein
MPDFLNCHMKFLAVLSVSQLYSHSFIFFLLVFLPKVGSFILLFQERFVSQLPLKATVLWGYLEYERQRLFVYINLGCFVIT